MKKLTLLTALLTGCMWSMAQTQMRNWVIPPYQLSDFGSLSGITATPLPNDPNVFMPSNYDLQPAPYASNGIYLPNNMSDFFCIDQYFFYGINNNGLCSDLFTYCNTGLGTPLTQTKINNAIKATELPIVPRPGDPGGYYAIYPGFYHLYTCATGGYCSLLPGWVSLAGQSMSTGDQINFAVTKLDVTGTKRMLFVLCNPLLYAYEITNAGISFKSMVDLTLNTIAPLQTIYNADVSSTAIKTEMEVKENSNGNYLLAFNIPIGLNGYICGTTPFQTSLVITFQYNPTLAQLTFDNFYPVPGANYAPINPCAADGKYFVKGMEFSPSGNLLYLTVVPGTGTSSQPHSIFALDMLNQSAVYTMNLPQSTESPYGLGMIEMGYNPNNSIPANQKLYFTSGTNLASIQNPDGIISNTATWNGNEFTFSAPVSLCHAGSFIETSNIYALPDQIDGENYDYIIPSVNPLTIIPSPSGFCTSVNQVTLSVPPVFQTYAWSTGSTSNTTTITGPGTYTVSVSYGCNGSPQTSTQSITIAGCCNNYQNPFPGTITTYNNTNFDVNSNIVVGAGQSLVFNSCNLAMADNVSITVQAGGKLTFNGSHVFSCNQMWQGIVVAAQTAQVNIINNSIIEDAVNAVYSAFGGDINFINSTFDHNYCALNLNTATYNLLNVEGCNFYCTGGYTLKAPYANQRTWAHIALLRSTGITIGNASGLPNTFNDASALTWDADFGIHGISSTALIINNIFNRFNYQSTPVHTTHGSAVFFEEPVNYQQAQHYVQIGDYSTAGSANFFNQCAIAVETISTNITIDGNTFTNNPAPITDIPFVQCIFIHDGERFSGVITHNTMNNFDKGINIDCIGNLMCDIAIDNDNLIVCYPNPAYYFLYSAAIRLANYDFQSEVANYNINNNQNSNLPSSQQGIHTTGDFAIDALNVYLSMRENKIYMDHDQNRVNQAIANGTSSFYGVRLENCPFPSLICNLVTGNSNVTIQPTGINDYQCRHAISANFAREGSYECNATDQTEVGMEFLADCDRSQIRGNTFRAHNFGLKLGATFSNCAGWSTGIIGDQATYNDNGTDYTYGNRFEGYNGIGDFYMASMHSANSYASTNPITGFYNWLYDPNYFPPIPPFTLDNCGVPNASAFSPIPDPSHPYYVCATCPNLQPRNPEEELEQRIAAANSVGTNQYGTQTDLIKYSVKGGLYDVVQNNNTLLGNANISNFYYTIKNSTLGKLHDVQLMISTMVSDSDSVSVANTKATALALNTATPVTYIFEQNQKEINTLMLAHDGNVTASNISIPEKNIAESVAWQCPFKGGTAVYSARAIVWKYNPSAKFSDDVLCNSGAYFREGKGVSEVIASEINLYPNPAKNEATLQYNLYDYKNARAKVYDITGKELKVIELTIKESKAIITLSAFSNGIYSVKIIADGNEIKNLKLAVIK